MLMQLPHWPMLQAQMAGAENMRHSHATFDLNNALMEGQFPKWEFFIQTMDPAKQNDYRFDPLDCTKVCTFAFLSLGCTQRPYAVPRGHCVHPSLLLWPLVGMHAGPKAAAVQPHHRTLVHADLARGPVPHEEGGPAGAGHPGQQCLQ